MGPIVEAVQPDRTSVEIQGVTAQKRSGEALIDVRIDGLRYDTPFKVSRFSSHERSRPTYTRDQRQHYSCNNCQYRPLSWPS